MRLPSNLHACVAQAALTLAAWSVSCTNPEPNVQYVYDPYEGAAFPGRRPKITIPKGGMGLVTDSRSDTISLIYLSTGDRFATYPVGRDPVTIDGPHHIAVDPAAGSVFVALSYPVDAASIGPHGSHGASLVPGYAQKLALDDLRVLGQVRVDSNPGDIVLSQDGRRLVVSHFDLQRALENPGKLDAARATLALIDPASMQITGSPDPTRIPVCIAPHGVALSRPDGARAFVACYGEDALAVVDLSDPKAEVVRVPLGPDASIGSPTYGPYAAVMSPDGATIAVSSTVSRDVRFFDVKSASFDPGRTLKTLGAPYFVSWTSDGTRLYVPTQSPDALLLVDVTQAPTEVISRTFTQGECEKPHLAEIHDEASLFVVCEGDQIGAGRVLRLDRAALGTIGSADVGVFPDSLARVHAP